MDYSSNRTTSNTDAKAKNKYKVTYLLVFYAPNYFASACTDVQMIEIVDQYQVYIISMLQVYFSTKSESRVIE